MIRHGKKAVLQIKKICGTAIVVLFYGHNAANFSK